MPRLPASPKTRAYLGLVGAVGLSHVLVLAFCSSPAVVSNSVQLLAAVLALALCCRRSRQSPDAYFRAAWLKLGVAFCLWGMAQGYYLASILLVHHGPPFPSPADFLWLLFALPMLMVIVSRRGRAARWEWVQWLDTAQACTFFLLLFALVFGPASRFSVTEAYDVQSVALMLACLLRYSSTPVGPERVFFRNLGAYLLVYGVFSTLGNRLVERGMPLGSWGDLCWSTPLLSLCLLILLTPPSETVPAPLPRSIKPKAWLPSHVHGLSALALCLMSVFAAVALHVSRPVTSMVALALALILFAVRTSARESQLHYTHDTLQHSVLHDALTGLANRTCLRAELARALSDGAQSGRDAALLFIDLDRFKTINDGLGHAFGDRLLIEVAAILASLVRPEDLVVRLGGDEFVIMMEHADRELAEQMSRKVVERLREPLQLEGRLLHITASVGVVLGSPGMQPYDLLRDADCAMYVAKNGGKNQAQVFEQSMAQRAREELRLETDLREALEADDLTVAYQPIYSLERHSIVGFEALARWQHPSRGAIAPGGFIPLAEETGLILILGKQILVEACRQVQEWNRLFSRSFTISVNVSARQFADPELMQTITDVLAETSLEPRLLHLEITESVLLSGIQAVEEVLLRARALGVQISLDDFGTGYSSLSYLLRFPFDIVKIDQSFVRSLDCDQNRAHVVRTIVQLATSLGKRVVAEGVETGKECEQLAGMGCDLLQGFLFSKPLPAAMIWPLLHRQLEPQEAQATASAHPPIQRAEPMPPVHALMIGPHDHEPATALRKATSGILLQK